MSKRKTICPYCKKHIYGKIGRPRKITPEIITDILILRMRGWKLQAIAKKYYISVGAVHGVIND